MLTEGEILHSLDSYRNGYDPAFVQLGHPYVYPIDSRINVFRGNQDDWALAIEVFGYCDRAGAPEINITYYGNCLTNLVKHHKYDGDYYSNSYMVYPFDEKAFNNSLNEYRSMKFDAKFWTIRNQKVELSHSKEEYQSSGIELKEYEPDEILVEEVCRLLVTKYRDLFRATDYELYKSIPREVKKILVIDEWFHKDFYQDDFDPSQNHPTEIAVNFDDHNANRTKHNKEEWDSNRPSSYETWQLIAKVLAASDISLFKPQLVANSNWKNWPHGGGM